MSDAIRNELEHIREISGGTLRAADVVDRARDPSNPMHGWFEWDDTEAAEAYRLHQARALIRASVTILPNESGGMVSVRTYISLPSDRSSGHGYRSIADVIDDQTAAVEALRMLRGEIKRLEQKYWAFANLRPALAELVSTVFPDQENEHPQSESMAA